MQKSVTRIVRVKGNYVVTSKSETLNIAFLPTSLFPSLPKSLFPYRVTYTKDEKGEWERDGFPTDYIRSVASPGYAFPVCFIPESWPRGTRMTRKVEKG